MGGRGAELPRVRRYPGCGVSGVTPWITLRISNVLFAPTSLPSSCFTALEPIFPLFSTTTSHPIIALYHVALGHLRATRRCIRQSSRGRSTTSSGARKPKWPWRHARRFNCQIVSRITRHRCPGDRAHCQQPPGTHFVCLNNDLTVCLSLISDLIGVFRNEEEDVFIWGDYQINLNNSSN